MINEGTVRKAAEHPGKGRVPDGRALAAALRFTKDADRVSDPCRTADMFPGEIYWDEDFWRFEKRLLIEREWLRVGHVGQIPDPGDHFTITLTDEPLIVSRDRTVRSMCCRHVLLNSNF